jgi:hypothetical protein
LAGREIEESLTRRDVSKCLAWFNENKTKLKKNGVCYDLFSLDFFLNFISYLL